MPQRGDSDRVRVGLAGLGRFGKLHAAVLGGLAGVELAALCDPLPEEVAAMRARFPGAAGFTSFEAMLDGADLDAVFIVTPEQMHAAQAMAAVERGLPVFVEKPLGTTATEGERVARAAAAAGVPLQVGLVVRFETQHTLVKARIDSGELGDIVSLRAKRNVSRSWFPSYGDRAHSVYETSVHDIDLFLWYTGSPVIRVRAVARNLSGLRYPDGCWALLEFASGAVGMIETSWLVPDGAPANVVTPTWRGTIDAELEIIGDRETARIRLLDAPFSLWSGEFTAVPESGLWPEIGGTIGGALREENAHFITRVRTGAEESIASVADAVAGLRIAEAIITATETGETVILDT